MGNPNLFVKPCPNEQNAAHSDMNNSMQWALMLLKVFFTHTKAKFSQLQCFFYFIFSPQFPSSYEKSIVHSESVQDIFGHEKLTNLRKDGLPFHVCFITKKKTCILDKVRDDAAITKKIEQTYCERKKKRSSLASFLVRLNENLTEI